MNISVPFDKLLDDLRAPGDDIRSKAVETLSGMDATDVAEQLVPMLQMDISEPVHNACMCVLENIGACISLDAIRQDHWFDDLKTQSDPENVELVTRIIGKRYLAYSILLGLQIQSIKEHEGEENETLVEFTSDSEMIQRLPLSQFCVQVASVLLGVGIQPLRQVTLPLTPEQALTIISEMPILVAPLFDLHPTHLAAVQKGAVFQGVIGVQTTKGRAFLRIEEFDKLILQLLRFDAQRYGLDHISYNFDASEAEAAFERGDYNRVIHLLEIWPGLLSTMLKTPAQKELTDKDLTQIAKGCSLLAGAYLRMPDRVYAQEVIRIAIRYTADNPEVARLYMEMGRILMEDEKFGEAIGYFRRTTVLSPDNLTAWTFLGKALRQRNRLIGAWFALQEAKRLDARDEELADEMNLIKAAFDDAQLSWPR